MSIDQADEQGIAIIGMAGRFPQAPTIAELWQSLSAGRELISFLSDDELAAAGIDPDTLRQPNYVKAGGFLDDVDQFDAAFFGYTPREAEIMDPQQRVFLECAWEALEHAGYNADQYAGLIGVYAGSNMNLYFTLNVATNPEILALVGTYQAMVSNDKDYLTTRVSYKLNLKGPSVVVQTACSTSLVAVHLACQALLNGECDIALAGGVAINVPQRVGYWYRDGQVLSPDGHCKAFSDEAHGTVDGSGVGIVVLKSLAQARADGDHIHAVIRGTAINNDGAAKIGYTAPSVEGQAAVISEALALAGVEPDEISYVEAHGTGTPLGDPIEVAALTQVYSDSTSRKGFCAIGSAKTVLGHLGAAAGVTGLIKTTLALENQQIPPSLHCERPSPQIDFANSPFFVNTQLRKWQADGPRLAGVSSFGIGGTNAHVILQEAPPAETSGPSRPWQLLTLSARTPQALESAAARLATHLREHPDLNLADVAYTYQLGRKAFEQRLVVVAQDLDDAAAILEAGDPRRRFVSAAKEAVHLPVAFLFPGQGAQYVQMAAELYQTEPIFQDEVDHCAELLAAHLNCDLRTILFADPEELPTAREQLEQTAIAQPALFVIEYALAKLWMAWGITPDAMIGHSIGEYVAACLAGVFSLEDALALVATRGRMMQRLPSGAMLSVSLPEDDLRQLLHIQGSRQVAIAAVNAPSLCVISGRADAVATFKRQLDEQGIESRYLHTSHAFHSEMMTPIVDLFAEQVQKIRLHPPTLRYLSNVSGTWITAAEATDPRYWARHLRETVRFGDGLKTLLAGASAEQILLEVGPGRTLSTFARQQIGRAAGRVILSSLRHPQDAQSDSAFILTTLGRLWLAGLPVDWQAFSADEQRRRLPLPTYPFQRQRYWIESQYRPRPGNQRQEPVDQVADSSPTPKGIAARHARPELHTAYVAPQNEIERRIAAIWQELLGVEQVGVEDDFFELGGHSLMGTQLVARLRETFAIQLPLDRLFAATTVAELGEIVEELIIEQIEALPEDEAQLLVANFFGDDV